MKPAFATLMLALTALPATADHLRLTVDGIHNDKGNIIVMVFDNARAFDRLNWRQAVDLAEIPAQPGQVQHAFPDLTTGPYAIFAFHDENGDEELNTRGETLLEGIGATGAPSPEDEPDFKAASVNAGPARLRIHYDQ